MKSNKTRTKILDSSLELFNKKKASNVSTVQISAAMKISPGNLYYYFANKEELIRCIWKEKMQDEIESMITELENVNTTTEFIEFFEGCFAHYAKYKFFYTEISTLFINDARMLNLYEETAKTVIEGYIEFFRRWANEGQMKAMTDAEQLATAENCVILSYSTVASCDIEENESEAYATYTRVAWFHLLAVFSTYFNDKTKNDIETSLKDRGFDKEQYLQMRMQKLK